jgi:hypothetical protein
MRCCLALVCLAALVVGERDSCHNQANCEMGDEHCVKPGVHTSVPKSETSHGYNPNQPDSVCSFQPFLSLSQSRKITVRVRTHILRYSLRLDAAKGIFDLPKVSNFFAVYVCVRSATKPDLITDE